MMKVGNTHIWGKKRAKKHLKDRHHCKYPEKQVQMKRRLRSQTEEL